MSSNLSYPTRSQFLSSFNQNQPFSFANSIIYYISKKPSTSKLYQKLIQSCKYFFIKNSILVISRLSYIHGWDAHFNKRWTNLNLNISTPKLWIIKSLFIYESKSINVLSSVFEKIYLSETTFLYIFNQTITLDQLLLLSSNVEDLEFNGVTVKYNNGSIVPLEKVIESLPKIKSLEFFDSTPLNISSQTVKELLKIPQFLTLNQCNLWIIPRAFDIESFYAYMKKNRNTKFHLEFSNPLSEAFKNRLEEIVDEIIKNKGRDYKPPYIYFPGMNRAKTQKIYKLSHQCL